MLSALILAVVVGQTPQAQWYPISNRPGWEGYGVPNGDELLPQKWRKISDREKEWVLEWKEVEAKKKPEPAPREPAPVTAAVTTATAQPASNVVPVGDPYGFLNWLNNTRAAYGLSAVGYDPNLSSWAEMNNSHQSAYGIGHFVMGPARRQNAAMGAYPGIESMWMASPLHRAALLDPSIRWIGIAVSGYWWTFNAN
jgi:uncharacterized protein YkwD